MSGNIWESRHKLFFFYCFINPNRYQYFLMDVLLFLGGVVSLFAFLVCKLCAGLCRRRATAATPPRTDAKKKRN